MAAKRQDPKAVRITLAVRVAPVTAERIKGEAVRTEASAGQVIDRLAKRIKDRT